MRISYGLRAFAIYFLILGTLVWFTLDNAVERLNDSMRQSAESVMVDMANLLAEIIEQDLPTSTELPTKTLAALFNELAQRDLQAKIYNVVKTQVDSSVIVTDAAGIVLFDSTGTHTGADFSRWNDVKLTLEGSYGARTSYINQDRTEPDDPKAMYIAAPIKQQGKIVGSVSLAKPIESLETHLVAESKQLQRYAFLLLLAALAIGYVLSLWFTYALNRISSYANAMAAGKQAEQPQFLDSRLAALSNSVTNLRNQVDGKQYVEEYVHSLTHELKTPLTSIGATVELLEEPMSEKDRARFYDNLKSSNRRMAKLVERMLSLAQLEGRTELSAVEEFDLVATINRLIDERKALAEQRDIKIKSVLTKDALIKGDQILLGQAIANLLDNALRFANANSVILVELFTNTQEHKIAISNAGEPIPEYALDKVFDRFFSLPSKHGPTSNTKSTGLGLSFVREIMKLHEGSVRLSNTKVGVIAVLEWPNIG